SARILTLVLAGLALNTVSAPVKGLTPLRALRAGFLTVLIFMSPGRVNSPTPFFWICRSIMSVSPSISALTCLRLRAVDSTSSLMIWVLVYFSVIAAAFLAGALAAAGLEAAAFFAGALSAGAFLAGALAAGFFAGAFVLAIGVFPFADRCLRWIPRWLVFSPLFIVESGNTIAAAAIYIASVGARQHVSTKKTVLLGKFPGQKALFAAF